MYEYISGKLVSKKPTTVVIDVHGVGYRLLIPASSYEALPVPEQQVRMLVHHYVREDVMVLFGFASEAERVIFESMLSVSGVGPKLALAALSALAADELRSSVIEGDINRLTSIPGVGRKTAERLTIELRDRFGRIELESPTISVDGKKSAASEGAREDALRALESLGLSRSAAERSLRKAQKAQPGVQSAEELVRLALREA